MGEPHTLPALEVRDLGLQIGGARILEGVSLAVGQGEMLGVIGPNGAGKTTLFNLVSGIHRPTSGSVLLEGVDVTTTSVAARARAGLGRTFQTSSLFPRLSVRENVRLAAQGRLGGALSVLRFPRRGRGPVARRQAQARDRGAPRHGAARRAARRAPGRRPCGARP